MSHLSDDTVTNQLRSNKFFFKILIWVILLFILLLKHFNCSLIDWLIVGYSLYEFFSQGFLQSFTTFLLYVLISNPEVFVRGQFSARKRSCLLRQVSTCCAEWAELIVAWACNSSWATDDFLIFCNGTSCQSESWQRHSLLSIEL